MRLRMRSGLKGAALAAATVASLGAAYQAIETWRDTRAYPPPGELVDVGGHRLHLIRRGAGAPTVVLDAGLAGFSLDWGLVYPEVARFTSVCAYDRAGYGWSERGPSPRTSERIVDELHALLETAGIEPPYVLVGHSFGGYNVRLFADRYPRDVAGMVLVDVSHEDVPDRLSPDLRASYERFERAEVPLLRLGELLTRFGVVRLAVERRWLTLLDSFDALPPRLRAMAHALRFRRGFFVTSSDEDIHFHESGEQVRGKGIIGDKPLVVLTGAGMDNLGKSPLPFLDLTQVTRTLHAMTALKIALHGELASMLSTNSSHIVTENSGHLIQLSEPQLVVDAIRRVVEQARAASAR